MRGLLACATAQRLVRSSKGAQLRRLGSGRRGLQLAARSPTPGWHMAAAGGCGGLRRLARLPCKPVLAACALRCVVGRLLLPGGRRLCSRKAMSCSCRMGLPAGATQEVTPCWPTSAHCVRTCCCHSHDGPGWSVHAGSAREDLRIQLICREPVGEFISPC
jgi:hypothetical protein